MRQDAVPAPAAERAVGKTDKHRIRLIVPPGVFRPPRDTWILMRVAADEIQTGATVADIGTGSGLIAVRAALDGAGEVLATDVSWLSVITARLNARLNGVRVTARRGDLCSALAGRRFDLILSNPPYVPSSDPRLKSDRAWHAGRDGRAILDRLIAEAPPHLVPGGRLLVVHSEVSGIPQTIDAMREQGLDAQVIARHEGPPGPLVSKEFPALASETIVVIRGRAPGR